MINSEVQLVELYRKACDRGYKEGCKNLARLGKKLTCPHCGKVIPEDSIFCPLCGESIHGQRQRRELSDEPFCPRCGKRIMVGVETCMWCGNEVKERLEGVMYCPVCGRKQGYERSFCQFCGFSLNEWFR